MKRRDASFKVALLASLVAHVGVFAWAVHSQSRQRISLPPWDRARSDDRPAVVVLDAIPKVPSDVERLLGRREGTGAALDDSPGRDTMIAPQASQAQAFLSRDPVGAGKVGAEPSDSTLPIASNQQDRHVASPEISNDTGTANSDPSRRFAFGPGDLQPDSDSSDTRAPEHHARAQRAAAEDVPPATPGVTDSDSPPADPAPMAESESDPFSTIGGVDFRPGRTDARLGRAHRITRPRIDLAGLVDSFEHGRVRLVLKIRIDATGNVDSVDVHKSSGSPNIDQACRVAAYQWWFEPRANATGQPLPEETFLFRIGFY
jgi:TonB family protein